tara:strand:- start:3074 stop:4189 length:1116 start_codon:yes stop_codon:yes gene_type:complete
MTGARRSICKCGCQESGACLDSTGEAKCGKCASGSGDCQDYGTGFNCPTTLSLEISIPVGSLSWAYLECCASTFPAINVTIPMTKTGTGSTSSSCVWTSEGIPAGGQYICQGDIDDWYTYNQNSNTPTTLGKQCCESPYDESKCQCVDPVTGLGICCTGTDDVASLITSIACNGGVGVASANPSYCSNECYGGATPCAFDFGAYDNCPDQCFEDCVEEREYFNFLTGYGITSARIQWVSGDDANIPESCRGDASSNVGGGWMVEVNIFYTKGVIFWSNGCAGRNFYCCSISPYDTCPFPTDGIWFNSQSGALPMYSSRWYFACDECCCPTSPSCSEGVYVCGVDTPTTRCGTVRCGSNSYSGNPTMNVFIT